MGVIDAPFTLAEGGYTEVFAKGRWHSLTGPQAKAQAQAASIAGEMSVARKAVLHSHSGRKRHRGETRKLNR